MNPSPLCEPPSCSSIIQNTSLLSPYGIYPHHDHYLLIDDFMMPNIPQIYDTLMDIYIFSFTWWYSAPLTTLFLILMR
jgi:hypothetical protein